MMTSMRLDSKFFSGLLMVLLGACALLVSCARPTENYTFDVLGTNKFEYVWSINNDPLRAVEIWRTVSSKTRTNYEMITAMETNKPRYTVSTVYQGFPDADEMAVVSTDDDAGRVEWLLHSSGQPFKVVRTTNTPPGFSIFLWHKSKKI